MELEFPAGAMRVETAGSQRLAGKLFPKEWQEGGRKACQDHSPYLLRLGLLLGPRAHRFENKQLPNIPPPKKPTTNNKTNRNRILPKHGELVSSLWRQRQES